MQHNVTHKHIFCSCQYIFPLEKLLFIPIESLVCMSVSKTTTRQKLLSTCVPSSQYCTKSKKNPKRPHGLTVVKSQNSYTSVWDPHRDEKIFSPNDIHFLSTDVQGICLVKIRIGNVAIYVRDILYGMDLHSLLYSVNMNLPSLVTNNDMNSK